MPPTRFSQSPPRGNPDGAEPSRRNSRLYCARNASLSVAFPVGAPEWPYLRRRRRRRRRRLGLDIDRRRNNAFIDL
ncbi:hypothetical protein F511_45919 [Dorcoceras hygrometricum]|uniref:Uncharacterized protein n=1 Tax=Dorcoceras hygrometricum TaxID=472368 RepID=A0A2Z7A278_9LAMI|nr:hypothetical protein F511_45919 [Dorcoceras hygrometricum]